MAAALAVSIREIIMAICRRSIAMIATLSPFIVNYIAIISIIATLSPFIVITSPSSAPSPSSPTARRGHFARDIHQKPPLKWSVCRNGGLGLGLGLGAGASDRERAWRHFPHPAAAVRNRGQGHSQWAAANKYMHKNICIKSYA